MLIATIKVSGVHAEVITCTDIPAGLVGGQIQIEYDDSVWSDLRKTVVFKGYTTVDIITDAATIVIPPEVVSRQHVRLSVGILGTSPDGAVVVPTLWADLGIVKPATDPSGDNAADPQLPIWAQLLHMIGDLNGLGTTAKDSLVAAVNELLKTSGGSGGITPDAVKQLIEEHIAEHSEIDDQCHPDIRKHLDALDQRFGDMEQLKTMDKSSLVAAVNEVLGKAGTGGSGGNVDQEQITAAVNEALAQAKASGEFDGKDGVDGKDGYTPVKGVDYFDGNPGKDGVDGKDGADGYTPVKGKDYFDGKDGSPGTNGSNGITPHIGNNGNWYIGETDTGKPSRGADGRDGVDGKDGQDGSPGKDGSDGVSATHSWNGTVLTVTSESGTSSADLKGEPGKDGSDGKDGSAGADGISPTVAVSKSGKVTTVSITDKNGTTTATINDGSDGSPGSNGKDGKTPVKGVDFWTAADQESIVQDVIRALGTPVFGRVDADNNIILTGELVEGTYTIKYEDADGNVTEIGTLNNIPAPTYTNVLPLAKGEDGSPYNGTGYAVGKRINSSWNETTVSVTTATNPVFLTGRIPIPAGATVRFKNCYIDTNGANGTVDDAADKAYYGHNLAGLYGCMLYYNATSGTGNKAGTNYTWDKFVSYSNLKSAPTVDGNGYVTEFTFNTTETMYARFVLGGDPTTAVITINEPID